MRLEKLGNGRVNHCIETLGALKGEVTPASTICRKEDLGGTRVPQAVGKGKSSFIEVRDWLNNRSLFRVREEGRGKGDFKKGGRFEMGRGKEL